VKEHKNFLKVKKALDILIVKQKNKEKSNTGKSQLNVNLSQGLQTPTYNLSYFGDSVRRSALPTTLSPYLICVCWTTPLYFS
jgi:hypothetical protein